MIKKSILGAFILCALTLSLNAQELPAPSPYAEVKQRVGLTDFTLMYSRPSVKEREIFGGLEAYGEVWRTGANAATKIEFSTPVTFGEQEVEAGTYSIFTIPGEKTWKFFLNTDLNATENSYDAAKNVAELEVEAKETSMRESMLFYFDNLRDESATLVLEWEKAHVAVPIKVAADEQAILNIENKIQEIEGNYRVYNSSARYYLDHDKDLKQALEWSKKSVKISEKFWNVYTMSLILHKMGENDEAIKMAKRSLELAMDADDQPYVKMNKENIAAWSGK